MTYIVNAVAVGARSPMQLAAGRITAEVDEPSTAFMQIGGETLIGVRYLLVTDDGTGYTSSAELAYVPRHSEQSAMLIVPPDLFAPLREVLQAILDSSPERKLALYLEANRSISRQDPGDPFPVTPVLVERRGFDDLWKAIESREIE